MVKEVERPFVASDGLSLYGKVWEPEGTPRAHMVFIHGFNDRCEIHGQLFPTLASSAFNIQTHSFDQRGWGKSALKPKQQGDTGPTTQVLRDIHDFVKHVASTIPNLDQTPLFLMGHSMGGQETLHYMLSTDPQLTQNRPRISGYIAVAPYVALDASTEPSALAVFVGKLASKILPRFQIKQNPDHRYITRDPAVNMAWKEDPLCHENGTLEGLAGMLQRAAELNTLSNPSNPIPFGLSTQLPVPTLWLHGTEDKVCAFPPSKALFDRLSPPTATSATAATIKEVEVKSFRAYERAYHKLQCEPDGVGERFAREVGEWIVLVAGSGAGDGADQNASNNDTDTAQQADPRAKL